MKIVGAVLVLHVAFVLLLEQIEAVTLDHARLCRTNYVSHGFRKDSFQPQAIHYCYPSNTTNGPCQSLDARGGINCSQFGDNYILQGGLGGQRASCCEKKGITLKNCTVQSEVFSHKKGYNIMYFERVLRQLISINSQADPTMFEIELCIPEYTSYTTPTNTPPPPPPSELKFP